MNEKRIILAVASIPVLVAVVGLIFKAICG